MKRIKLVGYRSTISSQGKHSLDLAGYSPKMSGRPRLQPAELIAARPYACIISSQPGPEQRVRRSSQAPFAQSALA